MGCSQAANRPRVTLEATTTTTRTSAPATARACPVLMNREKLRCSLLARFLIAKPDPRSFGGGKRARERFGATPLAQPLYSGRARAKERVPGGNTTMPVRPTLAALGLAALGLAAAALAAAAGPATAAAPPAYAVTGSIPGQDGGWDYVSFDPALRRLYVTHADGVFVVEVDSGKVTQKLADTPRPHEVVPLQGGKVLLVTVGGDNTARFIDAETGRTLGEVPTGKGPDGAIYDAQAGLVARGRPRGRRPAADRSEDDESRWRRDRGRRARVRGRRRQGASVRQCRGQGRTRRRRPKDPRGRPAREARRLRGPGRPGLCAARRRDDRRLRQRQGGGGGCGEPQAGGPARHRPGPGRRDL